MIFIVATALGSPTAAERVASTAEARKLRLNAAAPTIPSEIYGRLLPGVVQTGFQDVEGSKARKAWGVAVVDAPIGPLFSAINDDVNKPKITKLSHNVVLEGEACGKRRVNFQYLPIPILTDRWWVVELRLNEPIAKASEGRIREMAWSMVSDPASRLGSEEKAVADGGMVVAATEGGWLLTDLDGSNTLVEYWSYADPGGSVPVRMAESFASGGISDSILAMAAHAKAGPACTL